MNALELIIQKLKTELQTELVEIFDFSQDHAGHSTLNPATTNFHLRGRIQSAKFQGLNALARQRLVYSIVREEMASGVIHALSLELVEELDEKLG